MLIRPNDLKQEFPKEVGGGQISTTIKVWEILLASYEGDLPRVKELADECDGLLYAQYNYAPPIQFAVREGHVELVKYFLDQGAYDPEYRFYPFQESLESVAADRGHAEITAMLLDYAAEPSRQRFKGDNGRVFYDRTELQSQFETAVDQNDLETVRSILDKHPEFALDENYFWGEGILTMPAKENNREMIDLLMSFGAKPPLILKWTQFYYFEMFEGAKYMLSKGMSPNTMSWQRVTILHDMAQKGFIDKALLLLEYGAQIDPIDDAFLSTPLGLAARWGNAEMVRFLIENGADPKRSGAAWSTPLAWAESKGHKDVVDILIGAGAA